MGKFIDISGHKYNSLTVVCKFGVDNHKKITWKCICDCGAEVIILGRSLKDGNTKSCGCLKDSKLVPPDYLRDDKKERIRQIKQISQRRRVRASKEAGLCSSCCKNRPTKGAACQSCKDASRVWQQKNRKKSSASTNRWRRKNLERMRAYDKEYYRNNPYKQISLNARRRAQKKKVVSDMSVGKWLEILKEYDNRCAYCFGAEHEVGVITQDHLIPLFHGGTDTSDNIIPACRSCNSSKGIMNLKEWLDV